jgi:tetratricopeptide (TPR) repeat protein
MTDLRWSLPRCRCSIRTAVLGGGVALVGSRKHRARRFVCPECGKAFPKNVCVEVPGRVLCEPCAGNAPQDSAEALAYFLRKFQKGVSELLGKEDYETRFNLGIAYLVMGLLDEAVAEFQLAAQDESRLFECASLLGACYMEKGLPIIAARWFEIGLQVQGRSDEQYLALRHDLATALEHAGETDRALALFTEAWLARLIEKVAEALRVQESRLTAGEREEILSCLQRSEEALAEGRVDKLREYVEELERAARFLTWVSVGH